MFYYKATDIFFFFILSLVRRDGDEVSEGRIARLRYTPQLTKPHQSPHLLQLFDVEFTVLNTAC